MFENDLFFILCQGLGRECACGSACFLFRLSSLGLKRIPILRVIEVLSPMRDSIEFSLLKILKKGAQNHAQDRSSTRLFVFLIVASPHDGSGSKCPR